jgi:AcrR family transcriptional regulator
VSSPAPVTRVAPGQGTREAWLDAGQALLRDGGIVAVKLDALTRTMGLTTGSFYNRFAGMKDYLDQLASFYGTDQVQANIQMADVDDPRERLRQLSRIARRERMRRLDAAMRDWAGSNAIAANAVRAADEQLLRFMARAFRDLGYPTRDAQLRAQMLLSFGVARVLPPWKNALIDGSRVLDILAP